MEDGRHLSGDAYSRKEKLEKDNGVRCLSFTFSNPDMGAGQSAARISHRQVSQVNRDTRLRAASPALYEPSAQLPAEEQFHPLLFVEHIDGSEVVVQRPIKIDLTMDGGYSGRRFSSVTSAPLSGTSAGTPSPAPS